MYLAGDSIPDIAARLGVSRKMAKRLVDPRLFVTKLAAEGRAPNEIAARIGNISTNRVADFLNPDSDKKSLWPK